MTTKVVDIFDVGVKDVSVIEEEKDDNFLIEHKLRIDTWKNIKDKYSSNGNCKTIKFNSIPDITLFKKYNKTEIYISLNNIIDFGIALCKRDYKPLLLNIGDINNPGGKVENGIPMQEEEYFRRSNCFTYLESHLYPLNEECAILSKQVEFCYFGDKKKYKLMKDMTNMDMITIPTIKHILDQENEEEEKKKKESSDEDEYEKKDEISVRVMGIIENTIRMICNIGYLNGNDILVFSAMDCIGSKIGTSKYIANIFKRVVNEYIGYFSHIFFIIENEKIHNIYHDVFSE
jgi:hypothetical protein